MDKNKGEFQKKINFGKKFLDKMKKYNIDQSGRDILVSNGYITTDTSPPQEEQEEAKYEDTIYTAGGKQFYFTPRGMEEKKKKISELGRKITFSVGQKMKVKEYVKS